tara:strand:- start:469 stop:579 length:111 start_codon:yes stop_codon:yes gene_type:complete
MTAIFFAAAEVVAKIEAEAKAGAEFKTEESNIAQSS